VTGDVLIARFVLALAVLLVLAYAAAAAARAVGQPGVIGEVVLGLLLGPAVLGTVAPGLRDNVLPSEVAPLLNAVGRNGADAGSARLAGTALATMRRR
jgi:Kef-type K+ transport system membrane component KefB